MGTQSMDVSDFFPMTFMINPYTHEIDKDESVFLNSNLGGIWIFKPPDLNCGKGIQLITDIL